MRVPPLALLSVLARGAKKSGAATVLSPLALLAPSFEGSLEGCG